uniref:Uncharacterized protein LOC111114343 n=1 Tax=Crassostrea virginica TaxID=6565 RepID=A0A8B8BYF8_CRAVI|nr:uncharacterized protein LOC111114343 [Crassostrea virginica]
MMSKNISPYASVCQCSQCQGDTEYYCKTKHRHHKRKNIKTVYKNKRTQSKEILINIRGETLYIARCLRDELNAIESFSLTNVYRCRHISCATPDRAWISGWSKITLIDTTEGVALYSVSDASCFSGMHTVSKNNELIYIDRDSKIIKLSYDLKSTTTLIDNTDPSWKPWCVYCSTLSGDLLVGIRSIDSETYRNSGKVMRYNCRLKKQQIIPLVETPEYITENNNGDIVVSAFSIVVVTSRVGVPRFSYTGPHTSQSRQKSFPNNFRPQGICTDALSNILVCDACNMACTVHMLDRDGQFLSYLILTKHFTGINSELRGLSYDKITNRLLVGTDFESILSVYRYIDRHTAVSDAFENCDNETSPGQNESKIAAIPGYSMEEYESIYTARTKAKSAAKRAGKFAFQIRSAASKSAREAIEVDSESTEDTIIARKEIVKAADARALAETAAKANAAEEKAITAEQSAGKATTVEAAQAAAAEAVIEASKVKTWKTEKEYVLFTTRKKAEELAEKAKELAGYLEKSSIMATNEATSAQTKAKEIRSTKKDQNMAEWYATIAVAGRSVAEIIAVTAAKARVAEGKAKTAEETAVVATTLEEGKTAKEAIAEAARELNEVAREAGSKQIFETTMAKGLKRQHVDNILENIWYGSDNDDESAALAVQRPGQADVPMISSYYTEDGQVDCNGSDAGVAASSDSAVL